ncbi:orf122 [Artaxa digramma nucleopolyhedrovirus]|uniref:Orf122 n=1 Tax=Artaxa digramma nucleopolyhedrovirus TaxID=3070910 RepID=A0AAE6R788_9ABAC|nr:orf122 [Euproctis digramma nucleopolyhedrovirus]QHB21781.1 orf122 [Artaxa digramma nucleopolyhedrovirus]
MNDTCDKNNVPDDSYENAQEAIRLAEKFVSVQLHGKALTSYELAVYFLEKYINQTDATAVEFVEKVNDSINTIKMHIKKLQQIIKENSKKLHKIVLIK